MTIEEIDAFLAVVEYGTLSAAAERLFISQSTISQRIKRLETELQMTLFVRQQGQRSAVLTPAGAGLVPMAQQWSSLWRDMYSLRQMDKQMALVVGSVDMLNNLILVPLYERLIRKYPGLELSINTHHSDEVHGLLENRVIDVGFVFSNIRYRDIISVPVHQEEMYLIADPASGYYNGIHTAKLEPGKELYLRWGAEYELWHRSHWSDLPHLANINTGTSIPNYLKIPGAWMIGSASLVRYARQRSGLAYYRLYESPPPLICYRLIHRYPRPSRQSALDLFVREVEAFLRTVPQTVTEQQERQEQQYEL